MAAKSRAMTTTKLELTPEQRKAEDSKGWPRANEETKLVATLRKHNGLLLE